MIPDLMAEWVGGLFLIAFALAYLVSALRWLSIRRDLQSEVTLQALRLALLKDLLRQYHEELLTDNPNTAGHAVRSARLLRKIFREAGVTEDS
jgi:hypothetical protein